MYLAKFFSLNLELSAISYQLSAFSSYFRCGLQPARPVFLPLAIAATNHDQADS
jgi:hypothetical protein